MGSLIPSYTKIVMIFVIIVDINDDQKEIMIEIVWTLIISLDFGPISIPVIKIVRILTQYLSRLFLKIVNQAMWLHFLV